MPASPAVAADRVADLLQQQAGRRRRLVPTVSVLAGPPLAGLRRWRAGLRGAARPSAVTPLAAPAAVVRLLTTTLAGHRDLAADALAAVAGWAGMSAPDLRARLAEKTAADLDVFFETLAVDRAHDPVAAAFFLVRRWHRADHVEPADLLDRLQETLDRPRPADLRPFAAVAALVPQDQWPALFLVADSADEPRLWLAQAARTAAALVARLPALPVGLSVPPDVLDDYLRTEAESQAVALLREGRIDLPSADRHALCHEVEQTGLDAAAAAPAIDAVLARGADSELTARLADAACAVADLDRAAEEPDDQARSRVERFLFDLLDSHPRTADLFELNGTLDFRFGPRPAEVDLLARPLRLAVELDGGFWHLRDPACYRRDRRKDWELQRRGYLVLRFLAEDVVYCPQEIMDTILAAVMERRRPTAHVGEDP